MHFKSLLIAGLVLTSTVAVAAPQKVYVTQDDLQESILQVQGQITKVQQTIAPAIKAQAQVNHAEVVALQQNTAKQFQHFQQELAQLQKTLVAQIQQLSDKVNGTPIATGK